MSSVDITDGVLGLEAVHTLYGVAVNDLTVDPRVAARVKLDHIAGLHDLPDKDDNRGVRTGRKGEQTYSGQLRGKNITYEGRFQAPSLQLLRRAVRQARTAWWKDAEDWIQVAPQAAYGSIAWLYHGRVTAFVCDDNQQSFPADTAPTPFQRSFTLTVRQSDPRYYVSTLNDSGPHADGDMVTVHNAGDIDTECVIYGDSAGGVAVSITVTPTDQTLGLKSSVPGGTVTIYSYDRRVMTGGSGTPGSGTDNPGVLDTTNMSLWDEDVPILEPGDNTIQVRGLSNWHVQWNDASV